MQKTLILTVALSIICTLSFFAVFGKRGFLHLRNLESQLHKIETDNHKLTAENSKIRTEIELLKKNVQFIEDIARKELGLVKPNELLYHLEEVRGEALQNN